MSASLTCDQCGKTDKRYRAVGWYTISNAGDFDTSTWGDRGIPGDYCSTKCITDRITTRKQPTGVLTVGEQ